MIRLEHVGKTYKKGEVIALNDVNIQVEKGALTAVIGRNGAGKSTLFKIICGVITDYTGSSHINNSRSSIDMSEKTSYLPEERGLDGRMQVLEHLTDMVCYKGIKKGIAQKAVGEWLNEFGLQESKFRRIDTLSKGNQQKLQFIVAIASNPEILILDEPFSGLDTITSDLLWTVINRLRKKGCTIIFSTHNLNDKLMDCDEFIFIVNGKVIEKGCLDLIQDKYPLILEIQNSSFQIEKIYDLVNKDNIQCLQKVYYIEVDNLEISKIIFERLENKYCEKFYVRKMNITELFRKINGYNDNE